MIKMVCGINCREIIISFVLLNSYLAAVDKQAKDMFLRLVKQMAKREGVTEWLKADNQMEWVKKMGNIHARAREIVNAELIFS
ncbi:TnpV protein [Lientehia hominis]|uniref:TnpV protein n=1 Tax=Lientehia hominis TaxID=2897778 RepID=UPI002ED83111